jgi:nucleotide-binding universal stress UspA family protein
MYQRILVAVDGSETSQLALEHALHLAKDQRARLRIVHALESIERLVSLSGGYPFDAGELIESLRQEGNKVLENSQKAARAAGVESETALIEGKQPMDRAATILLQDAKSWDADLMVLGTHGRHGFDRLVLGSVAETLIRMAPLPVLLVRAK